MKCGLVTFCHVKLPQGHFLGMGSTQWSLFSYHFKKWFIIYILYNIYNIFHVSHFFYILGGRLSGSGGGGIVYDGYFLSTSLFWIMLCKKRITNILFQLLQ